MPVIIQRADRPPNDPVLQPMRFELDPRRNTTGIAWVRQTQTRHQNLGEIFRPSVIRMGLAWRQTAQTG
jgi:hypothetical protein